MIVIMLRVIMPVVGKLNVVMLNVVAPLHPPIMFSPAFHRKPSVADVQTILSYFLTLPKAAFTRATPKVRFSSLWLVL
jgi:hypothetical protein